MANIVRTGGGEPLKLNIYCQPDEPERKDGIWIQSPNKVSSYKIDLRKYFAQVGNFLGKTGYQSTRLALHGDNDNDKFHRYYGRYLWRPIVGNGHIFFVNAQRYYHVTWPTNGEHTYLDKFNKENKAFSYELIFQPDEGNSGSKANNVWSGNTNFFEFDDYMYIYCRFYWYDSYSGKRLESYLVNKYDKKGVLLSSSDTKTDQLPFDIFVLGTVRQEIYALKAATWVKTIAPLISATELYKVTLNGLTPTVTYYDTIPSVYASQRTTAIYDSYLYFVTKTQLIKYNTATKESETYTLPFTYSIAPTIYTVGGQIFICCMSLVEKQTYLFDIDSKLFSRLPHDDTHSYYHASLMCADKGKLLIFPPRYVNESSEVSSDLDVTQFDITKDILKNGTVALEDNPIYDAKLYESIDKKLYIRGLFGDVWLYEDGDYQDYPTYVGNGVSWRKVKN